jgi:hypothetical protein
VFDDAVDLARRALLDGSEVSRDLAVELLSDCIVAFHDGREAYGIESVPSRGLGLSVEQEMQRSLSRLVVDVYGHGRLDAMRALPTVAYQVAGAGIQRRSAALLGQALDLWVTVLTLLVEVTADESRARVADLVAEMSYYAAARLSSDLADDYSAIDDRLSTVPLLASFMRFQVQALKIHEVVRVLVELSAAVLPPRPLAMRA